MHSPVVPRPRQADPPPVRLDLWDKLPRALRDDPRLTDGDVRLAAVLIGYARDSDSAWPSNGRLASDLRVTPRTIRNRLRRLEAAGWFRCDACKTNATGRLIVLAWRSTTIGGGNQIPPMRKPVSPERDRVVKGEGIQEIGRTTRPEAGPKTPEPPATSTVGAVAPEMPEGPRSVEPKPSRAPERPETTREAEGPRAVDTVLTHRPERRPRPTLTVEDLARLAPSDPILARELARRTAPRPEPKPAPTTTAEMIDRVRECPSYPPMLAQLLTIDLGDPGSFPGFHAVAQRAYRGEIELDDLADAYRQGMNPASKNRGAVFMHAIKRIATRNGRPG